MASPRRVFPRVLAAAALAVAALGSSNAAASTAAHHPDLPARVAASPVVVVHERIAFPGVFRVTVTVSPSKPLAATSRVVIGNVTAHAVMTLHSSRATVARRVTIATHRLTISVAAAGPTPRV